jgi:hypothetical protein
VIWPPGRHTSRSRSAKADISAGVKVAGLGMNGGYGKSRAQPRIVQWIVP